MTTAGKCCGSATGAIPFGKAAAKPRSGFPGGHGHTGAGLRPAAWRVAAGPHALLGVTTSGRITSLRSAPATQRRPTPANRRSFAKPLAEADSSLPVWLIRLSLARCNGLLDSVGSPQYLVVFWVACGAPTQPPTHHPKPRPSHGPKPSPSGSARPSPSVPPTTPATPTVSPSLAARAGFTPTSRRARPVTLTRVGPGHPVE